MNRLAAFLMGACVALSCVTSRAQVSTNPNNSIVRFEIATAGTNFGTLDIELFDQDKPESVKNFLLYVYSGQYSNLIVHRLDTNTGLRVLQAGHARVTKPGITNTFSFDNFRVGANYGGTTNELSAGPPLSNTFGTLSAARAAGQPNSFSSDWFINLADNASLDTNDGGYTVFGRVINTDGPNTGTNLLNYFQAHTNITFVVFGFFEYYYGQLPISQLHYFYRTNDVVMTNNNIVGTNKVVTTNTVWPPRVDDLFTMQASILRGPARDRVAPKIKLAQPTTKMRSVSVDPDLVITVTNASEITTNVLFSGTATDNQEVARVLYDSGRGGGTQVAEGGSSWSEQVTLVPGTNTIYVKSIDWFGNESKPVKRTVFFKVPAPLFLSNTPGGTVRGLTNGQMLDIGRNYTVQAKPAKGNFFLGWEGSGFSGFEKIMFTMEAGYELIARFETNHFIGLRGTYTGLLVPRVDGSPRTAGAISVRLGVNGGYSGRLEPYGAKYPIRGIFNRQYASSITGIRAPNIPLQLALVLQTNGVPHIRGLYSDGTNIADVTLYRAPEPADAELAGTYAFALAPQSNSIAGDGFGVGNVTVDSMGRITASGTLVDGTMFTQKGALLEGGNWPVLIRWSPENVLLGWVSVNATSSNGLSGELRWLHPAMNSPAGEISGVHLSRYTNPQGGQSPFGWSDGTVTLSGDGLEQPISVDISYAGGVLEVAENGMELELSAPSSDGRITGAFVHPATQAPALIEAVVLQTTNLAVGYFTGVTNSGAVRLQPR